MTAVLPPPERGSRRYAQERPEIMALTIDILTGLRNYMETEVPRGTTLPMLLRALSIVAEELTEMHLIHNAGVFETWEPKDGV